MEPATLRRIAERRPFRSIRIALESGELVEVHHPENLGVTDMLILVAEGPEAPYLFEPSAVVSVSRARNGKRKR